MSNTAKQPNVNPLLAISYSLQRHSLEHVSNNHTLLLSAASTDIPKTDPEEVESWGVVRVGDDDFEAKKYIQEAINLASVDNVQRHVIDSKGLSIFEDNKDWIELPLLAQIVDLQHSLNKKSTQDSMSHLDSETSPQKVVQTDLNLRNTLEGSSSQIEATIEINSEDIVEKERLLRKATYGHLILVTTKAFETITPNVLPKDLAGFSSITVLYMGEPINILSWQRWSVHFGASLLTKKESMVNDLANRFQTLSRGLSNQTLYLTAGEEFSISSVTQLTPLPGPIPVVTKGRERIAKSHTMSINLPNDGERWAAIISIKKVSSNNSQPTLSLDDHGKRLVTIHINEVSQSINLPYPPLSQKNNKSHEQREVSSVMAQPLNGKVMPRGDQAMIGTSFAQQLSHRIRVIDNLVLSLLRRETRKSVKLIDQLIKITATLGNEYKVNHLRALKVQMLATGQLKDHDRSYIIHEMTQSPYYLSLDGVWIKKD